MSTKEILTLQFGHYANFVGTHWWNVQERSFDYNAGAQSELDHDVLFREGLTNQGHTTFTPRLLLVDLKGSLKTLAQEGDLYDPPPDPNQCTALWDDSLVTVDTEEKSAKNEFQKSLETSQQLVSQIQKLPELNNEAKVWSDFLYSRFHPRTVNVVKEFEHSSQDAAFDVYLMGKEIWKTDTFSEDFVDKIRLYMEECNNLQGFHVLAEAVDGFAGLASSAIEHLRDEYDRKTVLVFPIFPPHHVDHNYQNAEERMVSMLKDQIRTLNAAFCLESLSEHSSLFVPLSTGCSGWPHPGQKRHFQHLDYDVQNPYHTSSILAAALDTLSLQYRLPKSTKSLSDLCADLNSLGRKAAAASLGLPFGIRQNVDLIDCLDQWGDGPLWQSITPSCTIPKDNLKQVIALRGVGQKRLKKRPDIAGKQREMCAYGCDSVEEMLRFYIECNAYAAMTSLTTTERPLKTVAPFPSIFAKNISSNGDVTKDQRTSAMGVESVPVIAGLHSASTIGDMLKTLHQETKKIKIHRYPQFKTVGLEDDEFAECLNQLNGLAECYDD